MYILNAMGSGVLNCEFIERIILVEKDDAVLVVASYDSMRPPVTMGWYRDKKEACGVLGDIFAALSGGQSGYTMPDSTLFYEEHTKKDARTRRKGGNNMTVEEACAQAFENGRQKDDAEGYARGRKEAVKRGQCEFCAAEDNEFRLLNANTMAYSGIGIALNRQGLLRVRTYNHHTQFETQDIIRVKHCPNCGARMDGDGNA